MYVMTKAHVRFKIYIYMLKYPTMVLQIEENTGKIGYVATSNYKGLNSFIHKVFIMLPLKSI